MPNEPSESGKPAAGFPGPPGGGGGGRDPNPEDRTRDRDPHHVLNNPADDPDPTEWPDPYERRPDPRDPADPGAHTATGATSTSEPHPQQDIEAWPVEGPKRDKLDE
jgi:hypothetical protein